MLTPLLFAALAGATIPVGGLLAHLVRHRLGDGPRSMLGHAITAFGGGALVAAIALVLVPEGARSLPHAATLAAFVAGGVGFAALDRAIARRGGPRGQLLAMLADFVPEALALGALFAAGSPNGPLLAMLIALQNLPEGFASWRQIARSDDAPDAAPRLALFAALALLGPAAALLGLATLVDRPQLLGAIMVFAAGGILYLIFEDVAPDARVAGRWAPPLGAVAGFALGLAGYLYVG